MFKKSPPVLVNMNKGGLFLDAVKRIGFPGAHQYKASDFDPFFSNKELLPLLECFCSLTELNYLTSEEVCEFNSLSSAQLEEIGVLDQNDTLDELQKIDCQKREIESLEKQLALIERQNAALEKQKDVFKAHELTVFEEKDNAEKCLLQEKRKFQTMDMHSIAKVEKMLFETIVSISETVEEIKTHILRDSLKNNLPTSVHFKDELGQLLEMEKKITHQIKTYVQNSFQAEKDFSSSVTPDSELKKEVKEIFFIKKKLQVSNLEKIKIMSEAEKSQAALNFFENLEKDANYFHSFKSGPSVLRKQFEEAVEHHKKHQKKEKELYFYLTEAISDRINAQCFESALSSHQTRLLQFQHQKEKISLPAKILSDQRIRLELLMLNMSFYHNDLLDLRDLIKNSSDWLEKETVSLQEQEEKYDEKLNAEKPQISDSVSENPVLLSLYKTLVDADELKFLDTSHVTLIDIQKQVKKLENEKTKLLKLKDESHLQNESIEKYRWSIEKFLSGTHKEHPAFRDLDRDVNVDLNILNLRITKLESKISEFRQQFDQKKKLLERKKNLAMRRKLFAYALTNEELFEKCVKDIQVAMEKNLKHF